MLSVELNAVDNLFYLSLKGRLDTATSPDLEQKLQKLLQGSGFKLVVDMSELEFISSIGLRVILMAAKRAKSGHGRMILCGLQPQIKEIFQLSGFLRILETQDLCSTAQRMVQHGLPM